MDIKSSNYFIRTDKLNCAQAVLKMMEPHYPINVETMQRFAKCGGGNAVDGLCGALYAAIHLSSSPAVIIKLKHKFMDRAGCLTCKGIREKKLINCGRCVDLAVDILTENLNHQNP